MAHDHNGMQGQDDTDIRKQRCCMAAACLSIAHCCNHGRKGLTHVTRIDQIPLAGQKMLFTNEDVYCSAFFSFQSLSKALSLAPCKQHVLLQHLLLEKCMCM